MLILCDLPVETEPVKGKGELDPNSKKKLIAIIIVIVGLIVAIAVCIGLIVKLNTSKNISPYCMLMKSEDKVCKIHDKKHDGKDLSELIVSEQEMAFHQQLFDEISVGAYFDGSRLYKKEDAKELLAIKESLNKEKASLFERYLASTLKDEEKERYNFVIEELGTIEEVIIKLNIQEADKDAPTKEDLIKEVISLKKELDEVKSSQIVHIPPVIKIEQDATLMGQEEVQPEIKGELIQATHNTPKSNLQVEDKLIYVSQPYREINIPKDIESAATIKKSSLFKDR